MHTTDATAGTSSHAPGPPRFTAVGESVELAPRDPDPDAAFAWRLANAPDGSDATVPDAPVIHFVPDVPGIYEFHLEAPDGIHRQRVRAFPDEREPVRITVPVDELPVPPDEVDRISMVASFNEHFLCRDRPRREGDEWVYETRLPPGEHWYTLAVNDDLEQSYADSVRVPGPGRPRLRLAAETVDEDVVIAAAVESAADEEGDVAVEFFIDDRDDLSRDAVTVDGQELHIPRSSLTGPVRIHAVPFGERHGVADVLVVQPEDGSIAVDRPDAPPEWARGATVYEIFVRSFAGETPQSTFAEIERRVPYLRSLGVDVVWFTPICASPTDHGYHVTDYFETAADLGTNEEFDSLVETLHAAGIRVLFDLVINHTSRDHPAFQLHSAGVEAYRDHYRRTDPTNDISGIEWASLDEGDVPEFYFNWTRIPNLNYDSLAVRRWMLQVVDEWKDRVDGFRVDVAWGVPHGFWKEVADRVPRDFLLLDETLPHDPAYAEGEFHAHYDTTLYGTLRDVGSGERPAGAVLDAVERVEGAGFPDDAIHLRYVENHDEERYVVDCDEAAIRAAVAVTFTLPGAPMIYYGQERGARAYRGPMPWYDGDTDLTDFHRALTRLRGRESALVDGAVERVEYRTVSGDDEAVTAFARNASEERLLVAVNFSGSPATIAFAESHAETDLLSGRAVGERPTVEDVLVLRARD